MYMRVSVRSGKARALHAVMALDMRFELWPGIDQKTLQEFKLC